MKKGVQVSLVKRFFINIIKSRYLAFSAVLVLLASILLQRLFVLQIVNGETYQKNYTLMIEKQKEIPATRGCIYDRNGNLLAYNELAYSVVIEDNGSYNSGKQRSEELNAIIADTIKIIKKRGDNPDNNFKISYENGKFEFKVSGTARLRFLADMFGRKTVDELRYNEKLGFDEKNATAEQVMNYIMYEKYNVSEDYDTETAYEIAIVRHGLSENYYRKYISTTIATNVSEETVAAINENLSELQGVSIEESTFRKYVNGEVFCHITGYTGRISQEQYDEFSLVDDSYTLNDYVGKSGIEAVMESQLRGQKGSTTFYVDNMGKVVKVLSTTQASPGNNVYLSIDKELQETIYYLLEQEIAGVLYSHIVNTKEFDSSTTTTGDIVIPIYDVYYALINNNVIDIDRFANENAMETEKYIYSIFQQQYVDVIAELDYELRYGTDNFATMSDADRDYITYLMDMIKEAGILKTSAINSNDKTYLAWKEGSISLREYLNYAVSAQWIDITSLAGENASDSYSDTAELYDALCSKIINMLVAELDFHKIIYQYMLKDDIITGNQICMVLFEQAVLTENANDFTGLKNGTLSAYNFLKEKIRLLEITPAQLALDPCSGSSVVLDPTTGEVLACVSYPGYDTNKLANVVDSQYYSALLNNLATPLYNFATQQQTAPGSTFKPIAAAAGLTEGVITSTSIIETKGIFTEISNQPKCHIYRYSGITHGHINVSQAIGVSCNYFFYDVGYRLSLVDDVYNEDEGIAMIQKYASLFGLNAKTGIEIPENAPHIADEYPVMSAIGQSNHNYTTIQLARYVATIANEGKVYNLTFLDKVTKADGTLVLDFHPEVNHQITEFSENTWTAIKNGMRASAMETLCLKDVRVEVYSKTGTAQQISNRPSHSVFIAFAADEESDTHMAVATRIAFGYAATNAAEATSNILKYYFDNENVVDGEADTEIGQDILD